MEIGKRRIDVVQAFKDYHETIRANFPALDRDIDGNPRIYLDSAAGTLVPKVSLEAMTTIASTGRAQPGDVSPGERHTRDLIWQTRSLLARFLNASSPDEITFHCSTTHSLFNLAIAFRPEAKTCHNVIVTDVDHFANISPWESILGERDGLEIRRVRSTPEGQVDLDHLRSLVDEKTRIVAVAFASNAVGTVMPIKQIAEMVHAYRDDSGNGAYLVVDAVHHAFHGPIDVQEIQCDFLALSGYKLFGPMLGVLWGKKEYLHRLAPYCVPPNPNSFEQGTLNTVALAAMQGSLRYLLTLGNRFAPFYHDQLREYRDPDTRRFKVAMHAIQEYELELTREVLRQFAAFPEGKFRYYGIKALHDSVWTRDPTFSFEVAERTPTEVKQLCWELGRIEIADGDNYSAMVIRHLEKEGINRASFAHYDALDAIHALTSTVNKILP